MALHQMEVKQILSTIVSGQPAAAGFVQVFHTWDGRIEGKNLILRTCSGACDRARNPDGEFKFALTREFEKGMILFKNTTGTAYCYYRSEAKYLEGQGYTPGPFPGMLQKVVLHVEGGYKNGGRWKQLDVYIARLGRDAVVVRGSWASFGSWNGAGHISSSNHLYGDSEMETRGPNPRVGIAKERAAQAAAELGCHVDQLVTKLIPLLERKLEEVKTLDLSHMIQCNSRTTL